MRYYCLMQKITIISYHLKYQTNDFFKIIDPGVKAKSSRVSLNLIGFKLGMVKYRTDEN